MYFAMRRRERLKNKNGDRNVKIRSWLFELGDHFYKMTWEIIFIKLWLKLSRNKWNMKRLLDLFLRTWRSKENAYILKRIRKYAQLITYNFFHDCKWIYHIVYNFHTLFKHLFLKIPFWFDYLNTKIHEAPRWTSTLAKRDKETEFKLIFFI